LARMHLAIERYDPTSVLCLGDSFHDGNALQRMDDAHIKRLNEMIQQTRDWIWILGNHDPLIPDIIKGRRETEIQMEEICFAHEPCTDTLLSGQLMLFGHFHPKASAVIARHKVVGSCFVNADSFFIMPAFGKYTGGLSVKDDAIQSLLNGAAPKLYLTYSKKIYCV
ncbi:MAG: metallophosphoesterase, partial [Pseudomonadota bacterium]